MARYELNPIEIAWSQVSLNKKGGRLLLGKCGIIEERVERFVITNSSDGEDSLMAVMVALAMIH